MKQKSFDAVNINIQNDIKQANNKKINEIYKKLRELLKEFDKDSMFKNAKDLVKRAVLFPDKRNLCLAILNDLFDSKDSLSEEQKQKLLKKLNELSDIHRTLGEDIIRFLGLM